LTVRDHARAEAHAIRQSDVISRFAAIRMLFLRALLAFLALPGIVAFLVPALAVPSIRARVVHFEGLVPFVAGVLVLLWCVRDFYRAGKGTLAPWDPPRRLVRTGLYRTSRNPMYVGVLLILIGWTAAFRTPALVVYTIAMAIAFHLRVVLHEEPWLSRTFPGEWPAYKSQVPRWVIGRRV
jgi:protein-S-isoprenylcysteine O-methyltransferase Ste14